MRNPLARWSPRTWDYRVLIPLLIVGVSLVTALAISLAISVSARDWLRDDLREHAVLDAKSMGRSLVSPLLRDDVWEAYQAVSAVASADADKQGTDVVVLGRDDRVFVSSDPKRFPVQASHASLTEPLMRAAALSGPPGRPSATETRAGSQMYSVVRMPIVANDGELLGTVLMSYSHSLLAAHYADTLLSVALITFGFVSLLIPVGWWLGHRMAQPLGRATDALHRLAEEAAAKSSELAHATGSTSSPPAVAPIAAGELARLEHSLNELRRQIAEKDLMHGRFVDLNASLQERDARFRRLVDANIIGMRIADADGRITDANDAYLRMLGYSREDIEAGRLNTNDLTPPEYLEAEKLAAEQLGTLGRYSPFEKEYLRRDGSRVPVLAGGTFLDPACQSTVGFALDLTERRQAQAEREARRAAELANRSKSQFLSTMSHELRTPLNGILGYAQLLSMDSSLNERQRRGIETIRNSGEHLLSLIVDILDLSRIEAQRIELVSTPVELASFLRSVADVVRVKADEKDLILEFEAAADLPAMVMVDERRLRQVLLNLLGNAVKFTDNGTVSLVVSNEGTDDDHSLVRIDVRDTGVGIQQEDLSNIFEPFEQVGDIKRRDAGTGLGLTITRALISAMGGNIRVTSEPGRGTQFSIELRLKHAQTRPRTSSTRASPPSYEGRRRRILVIDDVAQNRSMLADFLAAAGFESHSAEDGQQGIEKVQTFQPDLVVMDSVMPVMSGLEATRRLRSDPAHAQLPIIAVSANATEEHRQNCLEAGANMCLSKPVRLDELAGAIRQLLQLAKHP